MTIHTLPAGAFATPIVASTCVKHVVHRKKFEDKKKPTSQLSYDVGLNVIRGFINYISKFTVEDVQALTQRHIPAPRWVKVDKVVVPTSFNDTAAKHLTAQLGEVGIKEVGGDKWWQWRKENKPLKGEWIEMRDDYHKRGGKTAERVLFFVHGGAYYFCSVDEHRWQIQRHARKLKARAFAPKYRLAPQYPFPCGLHDILAAYLYVLQDHDPKTILFAGDSAGGGMLSSLLITLRDQGLPLPAGAMLLSPWVDLTHSFPSICGDGLGDYIPTTGFIHRPSLAWPPAKLSEDKYGKDKPRPAWVPEHVPDHHFIPELEVDGHNIEIREQIQLYAANYQLGHPLVSSALAPSLGGLCPLLIQTGSTELLGDEHIYYAHKAANPQAYPPSDEVLDRYDPDRTILNKYGPTEVYLQVWDDLCHVPHTLAWTTPAKYLFRSNAQFGAWAFAKAQQTDIESGDDASETSSASSRSVTRDGAAHVDGSAAPATNGAVVNGANGAPVNGAPVNGAPVNGAPVNGAAVNGAPVNGAPVNGAAVNGADPVQGVNRSATIHTTHTTGSKTSKISALKHKMTDSRLYTDEPVTCTGTGGDPLPRFVNNMIRHRVSVRGEITPLEPAEQIPSLQFDRNEIGVIKEAPVHRWRERQQDWDKKNSRRRQDVNERRAKIEADGLVDGMEGEHPPPTALVRRWRGEKKLGRRTRAKAKAKHAAFGLRVFQMLQSKHDAEAVEVKEKEQQEEEERQEKEEQKRKEDEKKANVEKTNEQPKEEPKVAV